MEKLPFDSSWADFRSLRAKLSWTTNYRPDISCSVAKLAQVTQETYKTETKVYFKNINNIIIHLTANSYITLKFAKLDRESLKLRVYSDASYASNTEKSSQLRCIIFLMDKNNKCQPLHWQSYRAKRVACSVLGSEVIVLPDYFDILWTNMTYKLCLIK